MYVPETKIAAFVSYGEQAKMYTLRVLTEGFNYIGAHKFPARRDYYVQNLSTTRDLAIEKAKSYCVEHQLKYLSSEAANKELEEIRRRSHEEVERQRQEAIARAEEDRQARYDALMAEVEELGVNTITFGKYNGMDIMEVIEDDPEYVDYILKANAHQLPIEHPRNVYEVSLNTIYHTVKDNNIVLVKPSVSEHVGSVKDKIELEVSVKRKAIRPNEFGGTALYVFEDVEGNVYVTYYSGSKWHASIGDTGKLVATIKGHDEYDGVKQTKLTRAKFTVYEKDEQQED